MRVLLVEDDPLIGSGLEQGLKQEGFAVDWVKDGDAASLALRSTGYGLLLLDLGLPNRDGLSVLAALRRRDETLPAIIITARDGVPDRIAGLDSGADDYLVKPFVLEELLARIRAVNRRHAGRAQTTLAIGALRLDPVKHQVWLNDDEVPLSPKEFVLLHELMRDPGAVISREQFEERLYSWGEEIESNAVQVHIHNLRKKLGHDMIRTVRGVGYRIGDGT
ncbi:response regulator [Burkholderia pseudomultivorans]|uniref:Transcriptional regulatory protein QseB n=1 Tax=Burkholderia pseudomultivorans TaxID=1207504 RepID=A0ABU2DY83_9BURK|nr:response regulator [Burkholderia pseudomultivorans]MDR8726185.1 Transcriptional regulatory protein QseB [Burkholderia pseudomultivorans]MDR8732869.1 Transcriptional regulatory protein QseB [Burkholderia pseudomultivorans]MDR8739735.1 Transcriptional regulatory protein QseB [Burkholderia pseudomultivorans]MDR8752547.1 Transcriptional regulatory protein QseB [Burkholderia pseudomultivorans]MDR8775841.1 Transcriptional regulatory protein QseB [Burkholderia pseudomultivorans]